MAPLFISIIDFSSIIYYSIKEEPRVHLWTLKAYLQRWVLCLKILCYCLLCILLYPKEVLFFLLGKCMYDLQIFQVWARASPLTIHCQSKDDDLGVHVLSYNNSFEWSFYPNFFVMNTLFFCKIQWQDKIMPLDSYEEYRDLYGCHKRCYWEIVPKGAYLLKINEGIYDFCFWWPKVKIVGIKQRYGKGVP